MPTVQIPGAQRFLWGVNTCSTHACTADLGALAGVMSCIRASACPEACGVGCGYWARWSLAMPRSLCCARRYRPGCRRRSCWCRSTAAKAVRRFLQPRSRQTVRCPILRHLFVPEWDAAMLQQTSLNRPFGCSGDFEAGISGQAIDIHWQKRPPVRPHLDLGRYSRFVDLG